MYVPKNSISVPLQYKNKKIRYIFCSISVQEVTMPFGRKKIRKMGRKRVKDE
jgi:hypothetical protein